MERARRMKLEARRTRSATRGFTLVELLTVITIMAVLVTLLLGAVQSVRRYVAAKATTEMLEALDAALQEYYHDYGSYPYGSADGDYAAVTLTNDPYTAIPSDLSGDNLNAAILYIALTTRSRHGPYFRGGVSAAITMKAGYHVFRDGWGRMIYYMAPTEANSRTRSPATLKWAPPTDTSVTPTLNMMPPVLESLGPDEFNDADNMVNYGQLQ
jgi:prepilin-type N-terminal cleavage/methylation domain-containing protein